MMRTRCEKWRDDDLRSGEVPLMRTGGGKGS